MDLTTQAGQKQLEAMVDKMARSLLAGTTMEDFGVTADQMLTIAQNIKSLGEAAYTDNYSSSTSVQRTVTDIQGDQMLILLSEIRHWTRETAMGGVNMTGGEMPTSLETAIQALTAAYNASIASDLAGASLSISNTFNIDVALQTSIDQAMVEMDKQVRARIYQSHPRS